jgi:diketogulonate reductase-like aldo/keto reductase
VLCIISYILYTSITISCYHHIDWMRCGETVDPEATWKESWRALEKAYAEGVVSSIGVSNFGLDLMKDVWEFGSVKPHIVQNFADPSNLDMAVREFCYEKEVLYIPYASQRNLKSLNSDLKSKIADMAAAHGKTSNEIITRAFFQSHAAVIPRSDNVEHIIANIKNVFGWRLKSEEMISFGWHATAEEEQVEQEL